MRRGGSIRRTIGEEGKGDNGVGDERNDGERSDGKYISMPGARRTRRGGERREEGGILRDSAGLRLMAQPTRAGQDTRSTVVHAPGDASPLRRDSDPAQSLANHPPLQLVLLSRTHTPCDAQCSVSHSHPQTPPLSAPQTISGRRSTFMTANGRRTCKTEPAMSLCQPLASLGRFACRGRPPRG